MASITINAKKLKKDLAELTRRLEDATPAFAEIADLELSQTKQRFLKQVDPQGKKWPEPFTIRRDGGGGRAQGLGDPWGYVIASNYYAAPPGWHFFDPGRGDKILRDTGTLFNSISRAYGKNFALVGTNVEYAKKLQDGKFQFLGINKKTEENIRRTLTSYLTGALK